MKPAWDKLIKEYAGSKTALVADVDCTAEGKQLCEDHGVQGFPTIKWGDPASLEDYEGGRDFDALSEFAKENLKPVCSPTNIDLCDGEKKAKIQELQALPKADLQAKVDAESAKLKAAEDLFESEVKKLQEKYEELEKAKEATVKAVKDGGLGLMKAVMASSNKDEL